MQKIILLLVLCISFSIKANSQITAIHGTSTPLTLYQITDAGFEQVITSDIWVYTDESIGVTIPYTFQPVAPPLFNGTPVVDFRPMSCYDCRVAYGRSAVQCGPWQDWVENGAWKMKCYDINNTACRLTWIDASGQGYEVYNPKID